MRSISSRRLAPAPLAVAMMLAGLACGKTDDRPAVWTYVSAELFQSNCATASCHSRGLAAAGLDFSDPARGYKSLTGLKTWIPDTNGTIAGDCQSVGGTVYCESDRPLVLAFNPDQSKLVNMLRARGTASRMPPDRPMSGADISLVESWISYGARETPDGPPANYVASVDAGGGSDAGSDAGVGSDAGASSDAGGDAGTAD